MKTMTLRDGVRFEGGRLRERRAGPAATRPSARVYDCRCNVCKAEFKDVSAEGLDRFVLEHQHPKEGQSLSLKVRRKTDA